MLCHLSLSTVDTVYYLKNYIPTYFSQVFAQTTQKGAQRKQKEREVLNKENNPMLKYSFVEPNDLATKINNTGIKYTLLREQARPILYF
jgi:hypothetical protein